MPRMRACVSSLQEERVWYQPAGCSGSQEGAQAYQKLTTELFRGEPSEALMVSSELSFLKEESQPYSSLEFSFSLFKKKMFICVGILPACMSTCCMLYCMCSWRPGEAIGCSRAGVIVSCHVGPRSWNYCLAISPAPCVDCLRGWTKLQELTKSAKKYQSNS